MTYISYRWCSNLPIMFVFGDDQYPRLYQPSYYILFRAYPRFAVRQWKKASFCNDVSNWLCCKPSLDSRFARSHWETALLCNDVSLWLGANLESALQLAIVVTDSNQRRFWRLRGRDSRVYSRTNVYLCMRFLWCMDIKLLTIYQCYLIMA